ncbi:MAG: hypothetical protein O7F08_09625 [Deltaproteobacteria bacterium]|nr:hypothetical protein [Deltaproteobacteria bacterium]
MGIFARALFGLAAAACLPAMGCAKGSSQSLPSGSRMEAVECSGKEVTLIDVNEDGRADIEHFGRNGRRFCSKVDLNFDGKIDVERFYEADGEQVAHERHDFDFDGRIDQLSFYEDGRLTRKELDTNFDHAIDTWLWCGDGWVSRSERDRRSNGRPDVWEVYDQGLIVEASYDDNNDDRPEKWDVFRGGKLVLTKYDDNGDGVPDRTDEMPLQSMGPADDALRCERVEGAEIATAQPKKPVAQGSQGVSQGGP